MKTIKTLLASITLALLITGTALAGETQTPPCAPGETQTPPCASALSSDATAPGETQAPPAGVDLLSLAALTLDMLL